MKSSTVCSYGDISFVFPKNEVAFVFVLNIMWYSCEMEHYDSLMLFGTIKCSVLYIFFMLIYIE